VFVTLHSYSTHVDLSMGLSSAVATDILRRRSRVHVRVDSVVVSPNYGKSERASRGAGPMTESSDQVVRTTRRGLGHGAGAAAGRHGFSSTIRFVADDKQIGFRIGDELNTLIDGALGVGGVAAATPRSLFVRDIVARGLGALRAEARPAISAAAAAAGRHQLRVSLTAEEVRCLDAIRERVTAASGRSIVRAHALRECLRRGLAGPQ
jgi:hypothetical protein